jgi:hypothetical protein
MFTAHGVDSDDGAFDHHNVEQRGDGDDLVGFLSHRDLPEHEPLAGGEGGEHVDRPLRTLRQVGLRGSKPGDLTSFYLQFRGQYPHSPVHSLL